MGVLCKHGVAQQGQVLQEIGQLISSIGEDLVDIAQVDRIGRTNGSPCCQRRADEVNQLR